MDVEGLDAGGGEAQRLHRLRRNARLRGLEVDFGDAQRLGAQVDAVEALRVLDQRLVAARADIGEDLRHRGVDVDLLLAAGREEAVECGGEAGIGGV